MPIQTINSYASKKHASLVNITPKLECSLFLSFSLSFFLSFFLSFYLSFINLVFTSFLARSGLGCSASCTNNQICFGPDHSAPCPASLHQRQIDLSASVDGGGGQGAVAREGGLGGVEVGGGGLTAVRRYYKLTARTAVILLSAPAASLLATLTRKRGVSI